ncbi:MAG TPA: magnesium transporter [archaeon]|nr:magnesium transporter [archaeon]
MRHHIRRHLERLRKMERRRYHHLIHKLHKKHHISRKTLFYVKEYGPHTNVPRTIIRESVKILLLASIVSSVGGFALESIKNTFLTLTPFIILLPLLNNMIGSYGTIFSSKISTMLHEGKLKYTLMRSRDLRELFLTILLTAVITSIVGTSLSLSIAFLAGSFLDHALILKIFLVSLVDVVLLVGILFFVSLFGGLYFYKKNEDPNNFLIPITTSIADFGNMMILAFLIIYFF